MGAWNAHNQVLCGSSGKRMRTPYIERDVDAVRDGFCLYKCVILVLSVLLTLAVAHLTQEGTVPRAASPAGGRDLQR